MVWYNLLRRSRLHSILVCSCRRRWINLDTNSDRRTAMQIDRVDDIVGNRAISLLTQDSVLLDILDDVVGYGYADVIAFGPRKLASRASALDAMRAKFPPPPESVGAYPSSMVLPLIITPSLRCTLNAIGKTFNVVVGYNCFFDAVVGVNRVYKTVKRFLEIVTAVFRAPLGLTIIPKGLRPVRNCRRWNTQICRD